MQRGQLPAPDDCPRFEESDEAIGHLTPAPLHAPENCHFAR